MCLGYSVNFHSFNPLFKGLTWLNRKCIPFLSRKLAFGYELLVLHLPLNISGNHSLQERNTFLSSEVILTYMSTNFDGEGLNENYTMIFLTA